MLLAIRDARAHAPEHELALERRKKRHGRHGGACDLQILLPRLRRIVCLELGTAIGDIDPFDGNDAISAGGQRGACHDLDAIA